MCRGFVLKGYFSTSCQNFNGTSEFNYALIKFTHFQNHTRTTASPRSVLEVYCWKVCLKNVPSCWGHAKLQLSKWCFFNPWMMNATQPWCAANWKNFLSHSQIVHIGKWELALLLNRQEQQSNKVPLKALPDQANDTDTGISPGTWKSRWGSFPRGSVENAHPGRSFGGICTGCGILPCRLRNPAF